jgi:hypothetical protein
MGKRNLAKTAHAALRRAVHGCVIGIVAASMLVLGARSAAAADDDANITKVELKAVPELKSGRASAWEGTAGPQGDRYAIADTNLLQPVRVMVFAKDPAQKVRLQVTKDDLKHAFREGTTNEKGFVDFHFRTYDGFKLVVSADSPTPYQLGIWVGDEVMAAPPMTVPASTYHESKASATNAATTGNAASAPVREENSGSQSTVTTILVLVVLVMGALLAWKWRQQGAAK